MLLLHKPNQRVAIEKGELIGYKINDHEFIHQKESPGWRNSDTEMFPIIGSTKQNEFKVKTPKGNATLDQHGLLRELQYHLTSQTETMASFKKSYVANALVKNAKFPEKSTEEWVSWPYNFEFTKTFELKENELEIIFSVTGDKGMPFMLGYHPAFKLYTESPQIIAGEKTISLKEVKEIGSSALHIGNSNKLVLRDKEEIVIKTAGFDNFMLWTEVSNMICIEPITCFPPSVLEDTNFLKLQGKAQEFKVNIVVSNGI
ncbi:MAG: aldose 1-epimerase [Cellulophaga sp.]